MLGTDLLYLHYNKKFPFISMYIMPFEHPAEETSSSFLESVPQNNQKNTGWSQKIWVYILSPPPGGCEDWKKTSNISMSNFFQLGNEVILILELWEIHEVLKHNQLFKTHLFIHLYIPFASVHMYPTNTLPIECLSGAKTFGLCYTYLLSYL